MRKTAAAAIATSAILLSGCATIIDGSSEKIGITTGAVQGAHCVLSNGEGQWSVITPGKVTVERSKHDMKVTCSKQGYQEVSQTIPSDLNGWALVNFALAVVPLGVDAATGAINDYDDMTNIPMSGGYATSQPSYPSYPSTPSYPSQPQGNSGSAPAYLDTSPQYPQPTQTYDQSQSSPDQSQSYPDQSQSYPDQSQSYPDQSQSYPSGQQQTYPDQSQQSAPSGGSAPGTLPPLGY